MITPNELYRFSDPFVSAASGLVFLNEVFYLVADDDGDLFFYKDGKAGRIALGGEALPADPALRKKIKPDFESMTVMGAKLLLLPSFSKPNRNKVLIVDPLTGTSSRLLLPQICEFFTSRIPDVNLEGAFIKDDILYFLQRGNGKAHINALISLKLSAFLSDRIDDFCLSPCDLGDIGGCPLSFTDGFYDGNNVFFLAAAEASESTYLDGDFKGAVLGKISFSGEVLKSVPLDIPFKPEALVLHRNKFYIATDSDDPKIPSVLYVADCPSDLF